MRRKFGYYEEKILEYEEYLASNLALWLQHIHKVCLNFIKLVLLCLNCIYVSKYYYLCEVTVFYLFSLIPKVGYKLKQKDEKHRWRKITHKILYPYRNFNRFFTY